MANGPRLDHQVEAGRQSDNRIFLRALRWIAVGPGIFALLWLVVGTGVAVSQRNKRPQVVLALLPNDAAAHVAFADTILLQSERGTNEIATAKIAVIDALKRDPTSVGGWRDLAIIADREEKTDRARQLLAVAEHLSRRDLLTQIALIEDAVGRGQIGEALTHYDFALRVSPESDNALLPVLVAATQEPSVRPALARLLTNAILWRRRFLVAMNASAPSAQIYADLVDQMAIVGPLPEADLIAVGATNSAINFQYDGAWRLYRSVRPGPQGNGFLRNGDFTLSNPIAPFEWLLETSNGVEAAVVDTGVTRRMEINSPRGDSGPAARQLLKLPAGRYQLTFGAGPLGDSVAGPLYWQVRCGRDGPVVFDRATSIATTARLSSIFQVPAACDYQWLEFGFRPSSSDAGDGTWIDRVAIRPQS